MRSNLTRRDVLASTSVFLSAIAGCSSFQNSRILQTTVINHTSKPVNIQLLVTHDGDRIIEQKFGLPSQEQVSPSPSSRSRVKRNDLSMGSELKATIIVDNNLKETIEISINCGKDSVGDNIGFRVYDEYIDPNSGCAADRNITNIE